ncbi:MAG: zinc-ribbon domain-containing protein [Proteobacteria bacterium]|nr:zinc-ribbon domain-containing protein [Pseudomonadota bacterium]
MRLTCPNCGARYEVADSMIPPEGRDVQCSNCTTTWFQLGRRSDAQPRDEDAPPAPPPSPAQDVTDEPEVVELPDTPEVENPTAAPKPPDPQTAPTRQEIDPAIREILREEAAREARLRQAEADLVQSQSEMPLVPVDAAQATSRMRPELDAAVDAFDARDPALGRGVAARDLFPDIEQINSTLRDSADRSAREVDASDIDTLDTIPRRRRGLRIGFFISVGAAVGAAMLYANADAMAVHMPALAEVIEGYVLTVNGVRFWLDDLVQSLANATQ